MKITQKLYSKTFVSDTAKSAYLKACKWVANNVLNKVEIADMMWNIKRIEANLPTFKLELYVAIEESEFEAGFCERCKEGHTAFYLNHQYNCQRCNMQAYKAQIIEKLNIKERHYKNIIQSE
jgi:hypothetical protein